MGEFLGDEILFQFSLGISEGDLFKKMAWKYISERSLQHVGKYLLNDFLFSAKHPNPPKGFWTYVWEMHPKGPKVFEPFFRKYIPEESLEEYIYIYILDMLHTFS